MQQTTHPGGGWDHVTTTGFRPRDGLRRWNDWGRREFGGLQVRPADEMPFAGEAARTSLGPAVLTVMNFSPAQAVNCRPEEAAQIDDAIVLSLPQAGRFAYANDDGPPQEMQPGDVFLRDLARPWASATEGQSRLITLRLPYAEFAARYGDPAPLVGRRFGGDQPEVACLGAVIRAATQALEQGAGAAAREALARTVLEALALVTTVAGTGQAVAAGHATGQGESTLHRRALLQIITEMEDPGLTPARLAEDLEVAPRRLQRAFQAKGATVQGTILDMRLARAARILRDTRGAVSITGLAMSLGFNDMAYFSRVFARRYGCPPSRFLRG